MKLSQKNLEALPSDIPRPAYDRSGKERFIVHIGVGGFHRAHQAVFLHELLEKGLSSEWAICGLGVMSGDERTCAALREQDFLYTLMIKHPDGAVCPQIIGSLVDYVYAPADPAAAVERLADPRTRIVSLTITEGGYNFDQHGAFIFDTPEIKHDLEHPESPRTVFGLLAAALRLRRERGQRAFTLLSCDNIQHNGDVARRMLLSFAGALDGDLAAWIDTHVCFPNSMVDRITPTTTPADIELLSSRFGIDDALPVTCEPFIQWVLEDDFADSRPALEQAGVQFVEEIAPYEKVKLRLLNAGHSMLGFTGSLLGYRTIDEAVADPLVRDSLRAFMDQEVTPTLGRVDGIDLEGYKANLFRRFANPNIRDQLTRICSDNSAKLPKFLIPTLVEQLACGGPVRYGATIVAAWCRTLELCGQGRYDYPVQDALLDELIDRAMATAGSGSPEFLKLPMVFGDLADNARFAGEFMARLEDIRTLGIRDALLKLYIH